MSYDNDSSATVDGEQLGSGAKTTREGES